MTRKCNEERQKIITACKGSEGSCDTTVSGLCAMWWSRHARRLHQCE